jgi:hypothetical protein
MFSTFLTLDLIVSINIALESTTFLMRISSSPSCMVRNLKKFNGLNFKRWQQKMLFYLNILNLARYWLRKSQNHQKINLLYYCGGCVDTQNHINFVCNNYILNWMDNTLYDMSINSAKVLWKVLDKKYKAEDIDMKKFIVGKFLYFKMIDSRTVISQVQEFSLKTIKIVLKYLR